MRRFNVFPLFLKGGRYDSARTFLPTYFSVLIESRIFTGCMDVRCFFVEERRRFASALTTLFLGHCHFSRLQEPKSSKVCPLHTRDVPKETFKANGDCLSSLVSPGVAPWRMWSRMKDVGEGDRGDEIQGSRFSRATAVGYFVVSARGSENEGGLRSLEGTYRGSQRVSTRPTASCVRVSRCMYMFLCFILMVWKPEAVSCLVPVPR